jgi:hypothetical protein
MEAVLSRLRSLASRLLGRDLRSTIRADYARAVGSSTARESEGTKLQLFEKEGVFDYALYKSLQEKGNKGKLGATFAVEDNIRFLAEYVAKQIPGPHRVICHGTRNGSEQAWFKAHLPVGAEVLGTEISSTANQFADTIEWDFHETKPEWIGKWDVIYSNSWDHTYDPEKLFKAWCSQLSPRGFLFVEHTSLHLPDAADALDPFGASRDALTGLINRLGADAYHVVDVLENLPAQRYDLSMLVVRPAIQK